MKQTINRIFEGSGLMILCIGFLMCIKAAGICDFDGDLNLLARYALAGMITCWFGLFIHRWRV